MTKKTYTIHITDSPEQHFCQITIDNKEFSIIERVGVLGYAAITEISSLLRRQQPLPPKGDIQ